MDTHFTYLRPDLAIHQSVIFHTNTGIIKTAEGFVLVDPAFTQADFERIAAFIGQDPVLTGLSTHAHYDHLFWSSLFGDDTPRYCSEGTLEQVSHDRQEILDDALVVENNLFNLNSMLLDGHFSHFSVLTAGLHYLPAFTIEVVAIPGHLRGQTAFLFTDFGTLFAADTLSNIEPPSIEGTEQSLLEYLDTLEMLEKLIRKVDWIVPGHGDLADPPEAKRRLEMDRRYLKALQDLKAEDFFIGIEVLASEFIRRIGEPRTNNSDSWQIHLQNLQAAYRWLI